MDTKEKKTAAPFYLKEIKCPCCRKSVKVFYLPDVTSRLYYPKEKEEDQHVTRWEWKDPANSHINPYHHDILFCPNCSFSDFREEFIDPNVNQSKKTNELRDLFLREMQNSGSLIFRLSKMILPEKMNHEVAIYLHFLTIRIQELLPGPDLQENPLFNRDWKKLARLYLRTAWLFRENQSETGFSSQETSVNHIIRSSLDSIMQNHLGNVRELKKITEQLTGKEEKKDTATLEASRNALLSVQQLMNLFNACESEIMGIIKQFTLQSQLEQTRTVPGLSRMDLFKVDLASYAVLWPDIPDNENACVRKSVQYYTLAANNDQYLSDMEGLLMIEFCLKLTKRAQMKEELSALLTVFSKRGMNIRSALMKKKERARTFQESDHLETEIRKICSLIQDVHFMYKDEIDMNKQGDS
ncbi:MAG: DUF2225 domain-containing protein [Candidatus Aureabacteria bacterium]|nr:DUF2225 domain-containing protein [Candidatus Auribacterota bacterium]